MIKSYENQPNDDMRLMELAYIAYVTNDSVEKYSFQSSGAKNNDNGLSEDVLNDWAESAFIQFNHFKSSLRLLDSLNHLKK